MKRNIIQYTCYILSCLILLSISNNIYGKNKRFISIEKACSSEEVNYSGDLQHGTVGTQLEEKIRVQVFINDSTPLRDFPVYFEVISTPHKSQGFLIHDTNVTSDKNGVATTCVTLGDKPGDYEIAAKIKGMNSSIIVYRFHARKSNWVLMLIIGLIGGLGLFLFGMHMMSEGMRKSAGDRMRSILSKLTNNRIIAAGVGAFVTMIIQSSSVTTVMLVGFVQSRLMKFRKTIAVMLGASIGTTITAQLIAFKLTDYSLLVIGIGVALMLFMKKRKVRSMGESLLGFGILFFGMYIMSDAMYPLRTYKPFIDVLLQFENPILGILVGAVFTALVQSSSASIGIMIILGTQGLLSLEASIPLVMGANLGTAITAILASIKTGREARKVAIAHTIIKFAGLLIFVGWIQYFADLVEFISPKSDITGDNMKVLAEEVPRQIANAHTIFNVILVAIMLPFTNLIARFLNWLLPQKRETEKRLATMHIDNALLQNPELALIVAKEEAINMSKIVQRMVRNILIAFLEKDESILDKILSQEKEVDSLKEEIQNYVIKITQSRTHEERVNEAFQIMYTIKEFEQIGDIVSTNMYKQAKKWIASDVEFSEEGRKELCEYHIKALKQISRSISVFKDVNLEKAEAMKLKYKKYADIARDFERSHFERLQADIDKSLTSSNYHLEIINTLKMITSHSTNIARILLKWQNHEE